MAPFGQPLPQALTGARRGIGAGKATGGKAMRGGGVADLLRQRCLRGQTAAACHHFLYIHTIIRCIMTSTAP